jgi:hypothetical protein
MTDRTALLIGSLPFASEDAAMSHALGVLGDQLFCLPDGEIGEKTAEFPNGKRAAWVMTAINICSADRENWEVIRPAVNDSNGFPADYSGVQRLRPRRSPAEVHHHLRFGYDDYFRQSYPIFQRLREQHGLNNLKFQVGIPTGLGISFSMLAPITALRYADGFNRRLAYEVNQILKAAGDDVIIQIELPGELAMAYQLPPFLVSLALRSVWGFLNKLDHPARIGVHLCLGDLNNKALFHASTLDKMVNFSNALVDGWPSRHHLEYIHYPLAEAVAPPSLQADYYQPLQKVRLPAGTRFIAGFVHESRTPAELHQLRTIIETVRGGEVGIACSCGLGRRPQPIAEKLIDLMRQTAADTPSRKGWQLESVSDRERVHTTDEA